MTPVTVVSLTEPGRVLALRLLSQLPEAEHLHRPPAFTTTVQQRFLAGRRLILICATGIAVRTLAPVLCDKYRDPAVLVMDEHGRFIVPLLSGHEGGANEWARQLSERLQAQCVITSAQHYTHPLLIAGLGCERHCALATLSRLMDETLAGHGLGRHDLHALASIELKRDETGLLALAAELGIPIAFYPAAVLQRYSERLSRKSELVFRETGCYGVAEAAALAHAERLGGGPAELIIPKQKNPHATFAVARAYTASEPSSP
ncbi:MAG: cobalamin biosynthesis protein [Candidatus Competibacteraceae bacterium]